MKQSYNMRFWSLREKGQFVPELSCRGSFIKVPMKRYFFPHNMKIQRLKYRISKFEFPSIKIVGFTSAQSWTILPSKRHVTSTRDGSLCVRDSSTSSWPSFMVSSSEILDKLAKLFDSESLDIFLTSEFLLNAGQGVNKPEHTNWRHNTINSVPVSWPFLKVK